MDWIFALLAVNTIYIMATADKNQNTYYLVASAVVNWGYLFFMVMV